MVREFTKTPDGFDKMVLTMNSAEERDQMATVFHTDKPATHVYAIGWDPSQMRLSFQLVPRVKPEPEVTTADKMGEARRQELMKLDIKDLRTLAAESGVEHDPKTPKPNLVAMIMKREIETGKLVDTKIIELNPSESAKDVARGVLAKGE